MAAQRIMSTGITREPGFLYFIKGGALWVAPMKKPGGKSAKGKAKRLVDLGIDLDYSKYLYYLDAKLNVMRTARANRR